jgi:hypothetical protein
MMIGDTSTGEDWSDWWEEDDSDDWAIEGYSGSAYCSGRPERYPNWWVSTQGSWWSATERVYAKRWGSADMEMRIVASCKAGHTAKLTITYTTDDENELTTHAYVSGETPHAVKTWSKSGGTPMNFTNSIVRYWETFTHTFWTPSGDFTQWCWVLRCDNDGMNWGSSDYIRILGIGVEYV